MMFFANRSLYFWMLLFLLLLGGGSLTRGCDIVFYAQEQQAPAIVSLLVFIIWSVILFPIMKRIAPATQLLPSSPLPSSPVIALFLWIVLLGYGGAFFASMGPLDPGKGAVIYSAGWLITIIVSYLMIFIGVLPPTPTETPPYHRKDIFFDDEHYLEEDR